MKAKGLFAVAVAGLMIASAQVGFSAMKGKGRLRDKSELGAKKGSMDFFSMCEDLDLTENQKKQLKEHREKQDKERNELSKQIRQKNLELGEELQKDKVDNRKVNRIIDEIANLEKRIIRNRVDGILNMKNTLTPEQRQKLDEVMPYGMGRLKEELKLTDEQHEKVRAILKEQHKARMKAMGKFKGDRSRSKEKDKDKWAEYKSKKEALNKETDEKLSEVLTEEQMKKWAELREEKMRDYKKEYKKNGKMIYKRKDKKYLENE